MWFVYSKGDQLPDGALLPSLSYSQRSRAHCRVGAERPPSSGRTLSCTFVAPSIAAVVAATSQEGGYCVLQNHSGMSARAPTAASVSCSGPHRRSSGGRLSRPFDSHQTCFIQTRTVPTILGRSGCLLLFRIGQGCFKFVWGSGFSLGWGGKESVKNRLRIG